METKEWKWPIAPDGYIPNSVIRGWIRTLEKAKEEDEEFYIGQYDENYKSLIRRRNRKEHKITYAKWDYRPELDVRFNRDESNDGVPSEERKRRIWLKGDKKYDKDTSDGQSDDVTGKTDGLGLGLGFDFEFQRRRRPEGSTQKTTSKETGVAVADNRDKSVLVSKNESTEVFIKDKESNKDLEVDLTEKETSKDHEDEQSETSEEEIVVTPHTFGQKFDKKTMQPDSQKRTTQTENMNAVLQNADVDDHLQTIPTTSTVKVQKTMTEMGKVQPGAGKIDSLKSSETPVQKSGSVAARTEMREAKSVEDVAKPPSKTLKLSEASQRPASTDKLDLTKTISESSKPATSEEFPLVPPAHHTVSDILSADSHTPKKGYLEHTESSGLRPSRQTKSPKLEEEPKLKTVVSKPTATRNANAKLVDQKVLGIYKKFKTGKWVSQKAPGRWTSADVAKSSLKSKWSSGELEGLGTTESEHGPIEKTEEGEATRPIGQIGLWKLIMAGVTESMDPDLLIRLIKDRPADLQTSGIDIEQLSGIIDKRATLSQDGPKRTTEAMPQTGQKVVSLSTTKREVTIDQDALKGEIRDRATTQSFQQSTDGLDMGGSSGFLDKTGTGRLSGKGAGTIGQAASQGPSKDRLKGKARGVSKRQHTDAKRGESTTEYIDFAIGPATTDTSQASVSQRKSKISLGLERSTDSTERVGVVRPLDSRGRTEDETLVEMGPGLESQKSFLKSMGQTGRQGWGTQGFDGGSRAAIIGTGPGDKPGTSQSRNLLGLQMVKSMAHTPGLLISSDPEQFIKALSQQKDTKKDNRKPLPKWRQKLYQLIFLYGFCSPQTAKLIAKEEHAMPTTETEKEHEDRTVLLYEFLESVPSGVFERVVRRVQFQDVLGQDISDDDFHYIFPLSGLNNFITLDKFGETEYGKLLFEWERGDEE